MNPPAQAGHPSPPRDLPAPLAWGLPIASFFILFLSPLLLSYERWSEVILSEYGLMELGAVLMLLPACAVGLWLFLRRRAALPRYVGPFMLLMAAGAFYFAGEEASWGHWYFGLEASDSLKEVNRQKEPNLHNVVFDASTAAGRLGNNLINLFFNNGPRQALLFGCLVGGVILPLTLKKRMARADPRTDPWCWIIPTTALTPMAAAAVLSNLPEHVLKAFGYRGDVWDETYLGMTMLGPVAGEYKEFCFAGVILLYMLSVARRARSLSGT